MMILNFSHPLAEIQRAQIEALAGTQVTNILDVPTQFDEQAPFGPQVANLLSTIDVTPAQWQTEPILVVLPSLNFIAAALLAELHGRMGYFPTIVRTRPVANSILHQYEVAEILDLQAIRAAARQKR